MTKSKATMGSTLRRAATVARLAHASWKVKRSPDEETRKRAKQALAAALSDARGIPMKIGQFLATVSDDQELAPLCEGISPRPLETMLPLFAEEWDIPIEQIFTAIEPSQAAASLGQVHRALLHDGRVAAVKLQYPDIADAIGAELRLVGLMPGAGPMKKWGFPLEGYKQALYEDLTRELDYCQEAETQHAFHTGLRVDGLKIPKVYSELCTPRILVQEWVEGVRLKDAVTWSQKDRLLLAKTFLQTAFQSIFQLGQVHADPHLGNYLFQPSQPDQNPLVVMLDFGCTLPIDRETRRALLKLLLAARERLDVDPFDCFVAMGFQAEKLAHIRTQLPAMCMFLFEPFVVNRVVRPKDWNLGPKVQELLGEQRWWFRAAAPPALLLLIRAFHGLISQLETLDVGLPWWPLLQQSVANDILEDARQWQPPKIDFHLDTAGTFAAFAQALHVEICEHGVPIQKLVIPAAEIDSLTTLIPEDIQHRIAQQGINLEALEQQARQAREFPLTLFSLTDAERQYHVWLE